MRRAKMTKYIPLGESKFDPIGKTLELKDSHLEETVEGELSVSNGDATIFGEIEVKSDGSYELIRDGFSSTDLTFQEKLALQDRVRRQWQESREYDRFQNLKDVSKFAGFILGAAAITASSAYLVQELIKYFK